MTPNSMSTTLTNASAGAAVTSPWWLPALNDVSTVAAEMLPILGVVWLVVQISGYIIRLTKKKNTDE